MAKEEIEQGSDPEKALLGLINQSLGRNEDWKNYYIQEMNGSSSKPEQESPDLISVYAAERKAGDHYLVGNFEAAKDSMQQMLDKNSTLSESDRSWFLQEMARLLYPADKINSAILQKSAYNKNRYLLRPEENIPYKPIKTLKDTNKIFGLYYSASTWGCIKNHRILPSLLPTSHLLLFDF